MPVDPSYLVLFALAYLPNLLEDLNYLPLRYHSSVNGLVQMGKSRSTRLIVRKISGVDCESQVFQGVFEKRVEIT